MQVIFYILLNLSHGIVFYSKFYVYLFRTCCYFVSADANIVNYC